ncbi:hypothetical protein ASD83_05170 [Devosia sp. Root685]|uniref:nucleotidyltransferase domain-containing protein n=1 Tax=Devosia sp. Root685 TaxID=1736587 RepID=UPI0006F1E64A|nr:nucleotidyltransferase domain-containing protein [Devosia sp. Root685]KRA99879.1 hypothetical protein ASD83_05170 [Devosia sp. Root685]
MGVNLPGDVTVAGFRLAQVKDALRAYSRTGEAENFFELKSFAPTRLEAAVLYEELLERRFIDPSAAARDQTLTDSGLALASGKAKRSSLRVAQKVIDELLARVEEMNLHAHPLNVVQKIWLFGSAMREQPTVGDIDLAIEMARNPEFPDDGARSERLRQLVNLAPDHLPYFRKLNWHEERSIFGERRHALLAGAHIGLDELERLGVPCRLIFDWERGGKVDDDVVPRHPRSNGRSNEMPAQRELPDLTPIASIAQPMNARWVSGYRIDGRVSLYRLPEANLKVPGSGCFVLTDEMDPRWHEWFPTSMKVKGHDGVTSVVLKFHDTRADPKGQQAASLVLTRSVRDLPDEIEMSFTLSGYERARRLKPKTDYGFLQLCGMVAMIIRGDMSRQITRMNERGHQKLLAIDVQAEQLPDELRHAAAGWIQEIMTDPNTEKPEGGDDA